MPRPPAPLDPPPLDPPPLAAPGAWTPAPPPVRPPPQPLQPQPFQPQPFQPQPFQPQPFQPQPLPAPLDPRQPARSPYDRSVTKHGAGADEIEEERHYLATFGWTAAWYAVPVALFAAWSLTFPADPGTACARPTDNACLSPRAAALINLLHGLPRIGVALGIALLMAGLIRLGSAAWRPVTVGFSAAVIGAGVATVLYSVFSSTG
jgi:hypothetical protein